MVEAAKCILAVTTGWRRQAGEWRRRIDMPLVGGPMRLGSNASHVSPLS